MNTIKNMKAIGLLLLSIVWMAGCKDVVHYEDLQNDSDLSTGAPAITGLTLVDRTTAITSANLSQLVMIQGSNLSGLKSLKFNDVEADLKQAYVKAKEIIVPVPRVIPGTVTNKVTVTTVLGETTADLTINVPALQVNGLFNEFARPGDTTQIVGDNFDLYKLNTTDAKVMVGGAEAKILDATQTALTIQVPSGIPAAEATVTVTTPELGQPLNIRYRHLGTLINIQNKLWQGEGWITDGTGLRDPEPINGNFSHIHDVSLGVYQYYDNLYGCNVPTQDQDLLKNLAAYDLKFELNTDANHPLSQLIIQFNMRFAGIYQWNLYDSGESLNTYGQWQTITLDAKTVMGKLLPNNDNFFGLAINPVIQTNLDFSISSVRLVKKENILPQPQQ